MSPPPDQASPTTSPPAHSRRTSAILWQNPSQTVTLLDLPTSLALAQQFSPGDDDKHNNPGGEDLGEIASTRPLQRPFPSNPPKTPQAAARLRQRHAASIPDSSSCDLEEFEGLNAEYVEILSGALEEVRCAWDGEGSGRKWCLLRGNVGDVVLTRAEDGKEGERTSDVADADVNSDVDVKAKRKFAAVDDTNSIRTRSTSPKTSSAPIFPLELIQEIHDHDIASDHLPGANEKHQSSEHEHSQTQLHSLMCEDCLFSLSSPSPSFISNCTPSLQRLRYKSTSSSPPLEEYPFLIPPLSTFSLTSISTPQSISSFHTLLRAQSQHHSIPRTFNAILLDPPYPSSSVRRTHKSPHKNARSSYTTLPTLPSLRRLLLKMDLDTLMGENCLVGVWITNKPSIRELFLDPEEGLFAQWGLEVEEEWVWVKVTEGGETVGELAGMWRRPWEVLLLGRRKGWFGGGGGGGREKGKKEVVRRVIVAVPDLHSRKPCLRELLEPLILSSDDQGEEDKAQEEEGQRKGRKKEYRALEVFARLLVAGWWSWGDECIKFNWEGGWSRPPPPPPQENERRN